MKRIGMLALLAVLPLAAEEVKAPVTGAIIFKNGVSAVRRTVDPGKAREFDLACDIAPLQGSLWFTGPVVSVVRREAKKPVGGTYPLSNITKTYAGKSVTLTVVSGNNQPDRELSGVVWDPDSEKKTPMLREQNVWLKLAGGELLMIDRPSVRSVRFAGIPQAAPLPEKVDRRPEWHFTLAEAATAPVQIDFLSEGLSWQNACRIELGKANKMTIAMDAEIVNNLADLDNVPLYLASGYANFINAGRKSPMTMIQPDAEAGPNQSAQYAFNLQFANQVSSLQEAGADVAAHRRYNSAPPAGFGTEATGETEDISLAAIGPVTLKKGEVCHRVLKQAETGYERLVHWVVRARRNADYGRTNGNGRADIPMDALRFTNPFDTPITTSPLEILDGGVVLAQVRIPWVNPKQVVTVDVTRALSVTGKVVEYEIATQSFQRAEEVFHSIQRNKEGRIVSGWIAGSRYRVTDIQGEVRLKNYRKLPARILIELDYSGEFVSADGAPKRDVLDRSGSVNPCERLTWDLTLPAGEEKVLKYRYTIFVNF